jgi:hypothetical protein
MVAKGAWGTGEKNRAATVGIIPGARRTASSLSLGYRGKSLQIRIRIAKKHITDRAIPPLMQAFLWDRVIL